jgi:lipid-A-disaccharide synthase
MVAVTGHYPGYQFVVAGAPSLSREYYEKFLDNTGISLVFNQTYELLKHATAAVVTSGTATLETALLRVPEVVVYKTNPVTFFIGNFLVKVKFFSLVNLILDQAVVRELLQDNLARDIKTELDLLLFNGEYRNRMLQHYETLRNTMGKPGVANRVAGRIYDIITNNSPE